MDEREVVALRKRALQQKYRIKKALRFNKRSYRQTIRDHHRTKEHLRDRLSLANDRYQEVVDRINRYSALLPAETIRAYQGDLYPTHAIAMMRPLTMPCDVGAPVSTAGYHHQQILHRVRFLMDRDPESFGYHLRIQTRYGDVGYYINDTAVATYGLTRHMMQHAVEQMFHYFNQRNRRQL